VITPDLDLPRGARVAVAMSGGVDSSTVAAMLVEAGYETVGFTLQLYDHGAATAQPGSCCAGQDIRDARRVADRLGIAHYVLDYEARFRDAVIVDFVDSYARGETPVPCIRCNERVKFRDLLDSARDLGAAALATGHYARRIASPAGPELHAACEAGRDQSYFLFATTRAQLDFLRFPLGGLTKMETRALGARFDLGVADKPDSQDICFVPDGRYAGLVERLRPEAGEPGDIVHIDGRVLGGHRGLMHFTVGQRKGLGIGGGEPLFVVRLDAARRRVIVGPRTALGVDRIRLDGVNWLGDTPLGGDGIPVRVRVRSTRPPVPGRVVGYVRGGAEVRLDTPEEGVAPGQACVFHGVAPNATRILGGGWIRADSAKADGTAESIRFLDSVGADA
jgi:tRNA-specific 2-thiouridylase